MNMIYFISNRGGITTRFDPVNGKPEGEAFRVTGKVPVR